MADRLPVDRFRRDWIATLGRVPGDGEPLALAVSGGPDSMAMLVLAAAAWPGQIVAATFDHRLRAGSADEAAMVAGWCAGRGIPHAILMPFAPLGTANVQAAARDARYAALEHWAAGRSAYVLATAHHADDQAETFLMRANRGSGLAGLAGIRVRRATGFAGDALTDSLTPPRRRPGSSWVGHADRSQPLPNWTPASAGGGQDDEWQGGAQSADVVRGEDRRIGSAHSSLVIIRPLLGWRRAELRTVVEAAGVPFVTDPSNADARFDRARMRGFLADQSLLDPAQLARAASWCGEAEADLRAIGDWLWRDRQRPAEAGEIRLDTLDLPRAVTRRLARDAIVAVRRAGEIAAPAFTDATNIEPLLDALAAGRSATQAGVMATATGPLWHFRAAPPRRSP